VKLMPMIYATDLDRSIAFYERLGFAVGNLQRGGGWAELHLGDAILALHGTAHLPTGGERVLITLVAEEPLPDLQARLEEAGVEIARPVTDEAFGRSMELRDPDGLPIWINEHDTSLYT
jgi:catechol 2,3-dioxygenase-like lactoylglutathione lyase family enzyme